MNKTVYSEHPLYLDFWFHTSSKSEPEFLIYVGPRESPVAMDIYMYICMYNIYIYIYFYVYIYIYIIHCYPTRACTYKHVCSFARLRTVSSDACVHIFVYTPIYVLQYLHPIKFKLPQSHTTKLHLVQNPRRETSGSASFDTANKLYRYYIYIYTYIRYVCIRRKIII